jgi:hypothetical protein
MDTFLVVFVAHGPHLGWKRQGCSVAYGPHHGQKWQGLVQIYEMELGNYGIKIYMLLLAI